MAQTKKTEKEIRKGLEQCTGSVGCTANCPYYPESVCINQLLSDLKGLLPPMSAKADPKKEAEPKEEAKNAN